MSARIRFRPRITRKNMCFFLPSARIRLLPISEKKLISGDKINISKRTSLFQVIKNIFPSMFLFCLFFFVTLNNFFLNKSKGFFNFVQLNNFCRNLSNVFFIWAPSITFVEICQMCFFIWAPSINFVEIRQMFFCYLGALINFSKNSFNVFFFLKCFFIALPH